MTLELPTLPDKDFFSMGEISRIAHVPAHTLRYWEAKAGLKPARRSSGHRRYTREDLETILAVKDMIERRKMTLAGVKRALLERKRGPVTVEATEGGAAPAPAGTSAATLKILREVRQELRALVKELK